MDRDAMDFQRSPAHSAPASLAPTTSTKINGMREHQLPRNTQRPVACQPVVQRQPVETVSLQSILKGAREAIIDFDGAAYRLRITRNHRLILTK